MHLVKISVLCLLALLIFGTFADAKIVFSYKNDHDGIKGIYVIDDDGSNRTLLREEGNPWKPFPNSWSPDGKQVVYLYDDYAWERQGDRGPVALIFKAHRYLIYDLTRKTIKQLLIPKDWRHLQIDWMDDGESVVFSAYVGLPLNKMSPPPDQYPPSNIYKYHIWTHTITNLTNHLGAADSLDWISDDVLPVSPKGKKQVTLGTIKQ